MKTNFLSFAGRPGLYVSLALCGLFFVNCSNDDDSTPPTYEFEEEFQNIGELPELSDEDPEITEPDLGSVNQSEETQAVLADFEDGGELSAETQASIDAVDDFSAGLSAEAQQEAQTLTNERIEEIMAMTQFDGDLAALETSLEDIPAEIAALLPSLTFSADFEANSFVALNKTGILDLDLKNLVANHSGGPCEEAAQEAYDEAIAPAITARDAQLATIEANYQRRLGEAETRATTRQANVDEAYETYKAELTATAKEILAVAASVEGNDAQLAETIRVYALIFTVKASSVLSTWYTETTTLVETLEADEKALVETIRDDKAAEVQTNFKEIEDEATAILNAALNSCHNQGSGS